MVTKMENLIKSTAKSALSATYGFKPTSNNDFEIYDIKDRTEFKIRFPYTGKQCYQFKSYATGTSDTAVDGIIVWCGKDTITKLE